MPIQRAPDPPSLFRIGKYPDPLKWPPVNGRGRYGDPLLRRSTLYAAVERDAAFLETLDSFRPNVSTIAEARELGAADPGGLIPPAGVISSTYFDGMIVRFSAAPHQQWLDLRSPQTLASLRDELSADLVDLGYRDRFVLGDLLAHHHHVTRLIAQWAIDLGFHGIAYASCHDPLLTCWAIFEGAELDRLEEPVAISKSDPDLVAVARLWDLQIPQDR